MTAVAPTVRAAVVRRGRRLTVATIAYNSLPLACLDSRHPVTIDLAAGRFDSTAAITHTLRAFQALAPGVVTDAEIEALVAPGPGLPRPTAADTATDPVFRRRIFLRRVAGGSRVTIFEGEHEWNARAAMTWLGTQRKP